MRKVLFLLGFIAIVLLFYITSVRASILPTTNFDIVDNKIVTSGDPIPILYNNKSLEYNLWFNTFFIAIPSSIEIQQPIMIHLVASSGVGMLPPSYSLVSYNGIPIASGDCHIVTEVKLTYDYIPVYSICHNSDTSVTITWNDKGFIPWGLYYLEQRVSTLESLYNTLNTTVTNILTTINNILNTLTNHETRISALENVTTTTTVPTTTTLPSTTTTIPSTTTTIPCKPKYAKCKSNSECCSNLCNRFYGWCS